MRCPKCRGFAYKDEDGTTCVNCGWYQIDNLPTHRTGVLVSSDPKPNRQRVDSPITYIYVDGFTDEEYLTITEAAEAIGLSRERTHFLAKQYSYQFERVFIGKIVYITPRFVDYMIEERAET